MDIVNHGIKCNVRSCCHNRNATDCELKDIAIGNNKTPEAHEKGETCCASFDCL